MITTKIENKNKNNFKMIMENFKKWTSEEGLLNEVGPLMSIGTKAVHKMWLKAFGLKTLPKEMRKQLNKFIAGGEFKIITGKVLQRAGEGPAAAIKKLIEKGGPNSIDDAGLAHIITTTNKGASKLAKEEVNALIKLVRGVAAKKPKTDLVPVPKPGMPVPVSKPGMPVPVSKPKPGIPVTGRRVNTPAKPGQAALDAPRPQLALPAPPPPPRAGVDSIIGGRGIEDQVARQIGQVMNPKFSAIISKKGAAAVVISGAVLALVAGDDNELIAQTSNPGIADDPEVLGAIADIKTLVAKARNSNSAPYLRATASEINRHAEDALAKGNVQLAEALRKLALDLYDEAKALDGAGQPDQAGPDQAGPDQAGPDQAGPDQADADPAPVAKGASEFIKRKAKRQAELIRRINQGVTGLNEEDQGPPVPGTEEQSVDLEMLQQSLMRLGMKLPRFGADGKYGTETYKAIRAFQKKRGLEADGLIGPDTFAEMREKDPKIMSQSATMGVNMPQDLSSVLSTVAKAPRGLKKRAYVRAVMSNSDEIKKIKSTFRSKRQEAMKASKEAARKGDRAEASRLARKANSLAAAFRSVTSAEDESRKINTRKKIVDFASKSAALHMDSVEYNANKETWKTIAPYAAKEYFMEQFAEGNASLRTGALGAAVQIYRTGKDSSGQDAAREQKLMQLAMKAYMDEYNKG